MPQSGAVTHVDCQYDNIEQLAETYGKADVIFHLAWDTTPGTSARSPTLEVTANLLPTARLIEFLQGKSRARFIFVSSGGTVYGGNQETPVPEGCELRPISYYGAGKVAAEYLLRVFAQQAGSKTVLLRPSNIYGPGQLPKRQFGIIPTLLRSIQDDRSFTLIGGDCIARDFLFIDDFVSAALKLLDIPAGALPGVTVLNLAAGESVLLIELVQLAEEVTGRRVNLQKSPARNVDVSRVDLDTTSARRLLDWSARVPLREGLQQTWDWMQRSVR
jgi:UDP-glucose 4-epimerase